jgi:hypothetical protein
MRLAWPALIVALATALVGCTPLSPGPPLENPVRLSGEWSRLPDGPLSERHAALGVSLDGRFLVLGGWSSPPCLPDADCTLPEDPALRDGATFDPATGTWERIAPAPLPVSGSNAVVLDSVLYLLTRQLRLPGRPASLLRYDLASDTWTELPAPPEGNARLVVAGNRLVGISVSDELHRTRDWIFEPETGQWGTLPNDPLGPSFDREAVWADGSLILAAKTLGFPGPLEPSLVRLARLDLDTGVWTEMPESGIIGWSPTPVGELVVFPHTGTADGGEFNNWGRDVPFGGILDPKSGTWRSLPDPPPGGGLAGEFFVAGELIVVGGHLLDPATGEWTLVPDLPGANRTAAAAAAVDDSIVVWGGAAATGNLGDGYLLALPPAP